MTFETEVVSDREDVVARTRTQTFSYDPWPTSNHQPPKPKRSKKRRAGGAEGPPATLTTTAGRTIAVGDQLPKIAFPLTVYRLVMWAGAGRDFNSIHHNSEFARQTGAPEMYANTLFLMGAWERTAREWAGPRAQVTAIRGFHMKRFNLVGDTVVTTGTVTDVRADGTIVVELRCSNGTGTTVGPGELELVL